MNIIERIKSVYNQQSSLRQNISSQILSNPLQVCFMSLKEFASFSLVTEATILSYGRSIECSSYLELKKELQNYAMEYYSSKERISLLASQSPDFDSLYIKVIGEERKSLKHMYENNSPKKIKEMIEYIDKADFIYVAAHSISKYLSDYFSLRLNDLGRPCSSLDLEDISDSLDKISSKDISKSLLISITITPYGKPTLAITKLCKSMGMSVISITDSEFCPIIENSDMSLIAPTEMFGLTNSPASIFALLNLISILVQFHSSEKSEENSIKQTSKRLLNEYNKIISSY